MESQIHQAPPVAEKHPRFMLWREGPSDALPSGRDSIHRIDVSDEALPCFRDLLIKHLERGIENRLPTPPPTAEQEQPGLYRSSIKGPGLSKPGFQEGPSGSRSGVLSMEDEPDFLSWVRNILGEQYYDYAFAPTEVLVSKVLQHFSEPPAHDAHGAQPEPESVYLSQRTNPAPEDSLLDTRSLIDTFLQTPPPRSPLSYSRSLPPLSPLSLLSPRQQSRLDEGLWQSDQSTVVEPLPQMTNEQVYTPPVSPGYRSRPSNPTPHAERIPLRALLEGPNPWSRAYRLNDGNVPPLFRPLRNGQRLGSQTRDRRYISFPVRPPQPGIPTAPSTNDQNPQAEGHTDHLERHRV
ncbi:hypothetical protein M426DRAFT_13479 [Hypoxylon sp. CI-4A]|nr:hypothetical protein M426DRAFT_13479 [Hypoxylon sp. CI-4A]